VKALTLTQPWATLVAIGAKQWETRSWATDYRGPLAIHAAKGFPRDAIALCFTQPFERVLLSAGIRKPADLPRGAVIAIANLIDCRHTTPDLIDGDWIRGLSDQEDAFGDFSPGRYGWRLQIVTVFPEPIPARGALSLWEWRQ
jgi:hypothetical protein